LFSVKPGGRTVVHRAHQHSSEKPRSARPAEGVGIVYAGDRPTVCVVGRVDPQMVTEVSGIVRGLLAVGVRELVVDLTEAVDGPALQATLCRTRAELAETGGGLRVVGVALSEFLPALYGATLDEVFLVYATVRQNPARQDSGCDGRDAVAPSGPLCRRTLASTDACEGWR
jgi:hypothetical protein